MISGNGLHGFFGDGGASEDLMALLVAAEIVNDLYVARQNATSNKGAADLAKK